jgi:trehalose synthase
MLQTVDVGERSLAAYEGIVAEDLLAQLRTIASDLRGVRIAHINATPYGGGVSELLRSIVPLCNDLGLIADWKIISGDAPFFEVTKKIHNGLQGGGFSLSAEERARYEQTAAANAAELREKYDIIFIHDPQPAALLSFHGKDDARWVWRCHIDTGQPSPDIWSFCRQFLVDYDAAVFTMAEFVPPDLPVHHVELVPPAIDPLSPKNMHLAESTARHVLDWIGINLSRPLITQVSRFDPWKDPLGVIAAYRMVRKDVLNLQLALVGSMALDDPEGWEIYRDIKEIAESDPLIHVFTNLTGVGNIEVNAFQRLSDVVVQKSIREGFGLVVSESLWKETPVVAGRAGGIPLQMSNGLEELLVDSVDECADRILRLLRDSERADELARMGSERVREHFLLPRLLLDELSLARDLLTGTERPLAVLHGERDPVCGMAVVPTEAVHLLHEGLHLNFCSDACKARFLARPARYLRMGQE